MDINGYKINKVIESCETEDQLSVAAKYASLALMDWRRKNGGGGFYRLSSDISHYLGFKLGRITAPKR